MKRIIRSDLAQVEYKVTVKYPTSNSTLSRSLDYLIRKPDILTIGEDFIEWVVFYRSQSFASKAVKKISHLKATNEFEVDMVAQNGLGERVNT